MWGRLLRLFLGALLFAALASPLAASSFLLTHFGDSGGASFDFKVDSVSGSDATNCQFATPCQTLARLKTFLNGTTGKRVCFAKGSTWTEEFSLTTTNGFYDSCGSGAAPFFDGSSPLANASFSLAPAQIFTYQISVAAPTSSSSAEFRNVFVNNQFSIIKTSIANVEATACSAFVNPATGAGAITIYVHPCGNTNPTSDGKTYAWTSVLTTIDIQGNGNTLRAVHARRARDNGGSIRLSGSGNILDGCLDEDGNKHAAIIGNSATVENCTFSNAYFGPSGNPNLLVVNSDVGDGVSPVITNDIFQSTAAVRQAGTIASGDYPTGVISHTNVSGSFGRPQLSGNTYTELDTATGFENVAGLDSTGETWTNVNQIGFATAAFDAAYTGCTGTVTALIAGSNWVGFSPSGAARTVLTFNNCTMSGTRGVRFFGNHTDLRFNGGAWTGGTAGTTDAAIYYDFGSDATWQMNGTTVNVPASGKSFIAYITGMTYQASNNNVFNSNSFARKWLFNFAPIATTLLTWQTFSGQDANSTSP